MQRKGRGTVWFSHPVYVRGRGNCVGKKEGEGPLGRYFDRVVEDEYFGEDSFEKAEMKLQKSALCYALKRAGITEAEIDTMGAGDLLNQCVASGYTAAEVGAPFVGLYGACSTMALSVLVTSVMLGAGTGKYGVAVTGSHFCSAERQFRYPLEYGGQRPPTAQWTVTGAGALVLSARGDKGVCIRGFQLGKVLDYGIVDLNNMGAAMAPAAADTIETYLKNTRTAPEDYDAIVTGDLGKVGADILQDMLAQRGYPLGKTYWDCGKMIYDEMQDVHAGGSGCGCSASVLTAYWLPKLEKGELRRVLFAATGALMSPLTVQQKNSIPAVAHLICFEGGNEK